MSLDNATKREVIAPAFPAGKGIRWRLLTTMIGLVTALVIVLSIVHTRDQHESMKRELELRISLQRDVLYQRGRAVSEELAGHVEDHLDARDLTGVSQRLVEAATNRKDVLFIALTDASGRFIVHTQQPDLVQRPGAAEPGPGEAASESVAERNDGAGRYLEFTRTLHVGNEYRGTLKVAFSLASIDRYADQARLEMLANARRARTRQVAVVAAFLVAGVLVVLWQSVKMTAPIVKLTDTSLRLAAGDFAAAKSLHVEGNDEVAALGRAFVTMAGNLSASHQRTESMVEITRRTETFLDSIVENLPNMIFVKDAQELRFVRFNRAGEELLGYTRAELIGKNDYDFFSREEADAFTRRDREVLASGRMLDIPEEPIQTRNRGLRFLHTKKIPIFNASGEPMYLLGISEDITERKHLEDERKAFFSQSLDLLCIADFEGHFIQLNPAFERALGYTLDELMSRPYFAFVHEEDIDRTAEVARQLTLGQELVSFENRYICKDGTYRYFLWTATADVSTRRIYAAARDMTERYMLEQQIVQISTREQERIAHDLHDGLGQILTGLAYKSKLLEGNIKDGTAPPAGLAQEIVRLANQASQQARAIARGLDPVVLDEGLALALQDLAYTTSDIMGINCVFMSDQPAEAVDKFTAIHLYRIAQEAVNNAVKHGKSRTVTVALTSHSNQVILMIADDGVGMNSSSEPRRGMGIHNMMYRARIIRGSLAITPNANGGTTVTCSIQEKFVRRRDIPEMA